MKSIKEKCNDYVNFEYSQIKEYRELNKIDLLLACDKAIDIVNTWNKVSDRLPREGTFDIYKPFLVKVWLSDFDKTEIILTAYFTWRDKKWYFPERDLSLG